MKNFLLILFGILFLFNLTFVQAHFVCGIVNNADDGMSASWQGVKIFYPGQEDNYASCEVSPEDNKYCCDIEEIHQDWQVGDIVIVKVADVNRGYVAGPTQLVLTNEAFDIAPFINLEKVIKIFEPQKKIILSNNSLIFLNLSFLPPYNFVELEMNGERKNLCENCSIYFGNFSFNFGMNTFKILAGFGNEFFYEENSFAIFDEINFDRKLDCKGCKNNKVKSSSLVKMNLNLSFSYEVENFLFKEYVPSSWEVVDLGEGELKNFDENFNVIIWEVSGNEISRHYSIRAPSIDFRPQEFIFKSQLEDFDLEADKILVKKFLPFWKIHKLSLIGGDNISNKTNIDLSHPLVFNLDEGGLEGAVFVNHAVDEAMFEVHKSDSFLKNKKNEVIQGYFVKTNLGKEDILHILFEVKIKKSLIKNKISFFKESFLNKEEINPLFVHEDSGYFYFSFKEDLFDKFWIQDSKKSF